jgi:hypothetical protein
LAGFFFLLVVAVDAVADAADDVDVVRAGVLVDVVRDGGFFSSSSSELNGHTHAHAAVRSPSPASGPADDCVMPRKTPNICVDVNRLVYAHKMIISSTVSIKMYAYRYDDDVAFQLWRHLINRSNLHTHVKTTTASTGSIFEQAPRET